MKHLFCLLLLFVSSCLGCYDVYPNTDLMGGDLWFLPGLSYADCGNQCCGTNGCVGFSWQASSSGNYCWLKSSIPYTPGTYTSSVIQSGKKSCSQCAVSVYSNMDAPGGDYKSMALNYDDCNTQCCGESQCRAFTWTATAPNGGTSPGCTVGQNCCYLKSSVPAPTAYNNLITEIKMADSSCSFGFNANSDRPGGDYKSMVLSFAACQAQCCNEAQCVSFTHASSAPNGGVGGACTVGGNCCYLKSSAPGVSTYSGLISGVKNVAATSPPAPTTPPAPTCPPYTYFPGKDFPGGDMWNGMIDSAACQAQCCANSACVGYQFIAYTISQLGNCAEGRNCCLMKNYMNGATSQNYQNMYSYVKQGYNLNH